MDADQGDPGRIELLEPLAVADGDQPVPCAMEDIGMTADPGKPEIRTQVIPQYIPQGQDRKEPLHHFREIIIRTVQDQVVGIVIRGNTGGKTAADTPAIDDHVLIRTLCQEGLIDELDIIQHGRFPPAARTLAESPVVYQHHIIIIPVKIPGIFGPSFYTTCIAMKIKDQPCGGRPEKMQSIDPHTRLYIEKQFFKRDIVFVLEAGRQLLRLEDKFLLYKIDEQE